MQGEAARRGGYTDVPADIMRNKAVSAPRLASLRALHETIWEHTLIFTYDDSRGA